MTWDEFSIWLQQPEQGYRMPFRIDGSRYAAMCQRVYGWSIIVGDVGDRCGFNEEYSYRSVREALDGFLRWSGEDFEGQPQGWVRHTQRGGPTERRQRND